MKNWIEILAEQVAKKNKQAVADEIGVSRTAISLVLDGKYPASTDNLERKVLERYSIVVCPFLNREISNKQCREHHSAKAPTSSPRAMRHWRVCQSCEHNKGDSHE